ncbi:MAG: NYN domain-containing protein [Planctomycetota bacterium]
MPLIVDTYNVLHVTGVLPPGLAGIDPPDLARLIQTSRFRHDEALLICDGVPKPDAPPGRDGQVITRYAGPGVTADEMIAKLVNDDSAPRRLIVVSSDNEVLRAARRRRCKTLTSEEFLRQLADDAHLDDATSRPSTPPSHVPSEDVSRWQKEFGVDDLESLLPAALPPHLADALDALHVPPSKPSTTPSAPGEAADPPSTAPAPPDPSTFAAMFPTDLMAEASQLEANHDGLPPIMPPSTDDAGVEVSDENDADPETTDEPAAPQPGIDLNRLDELDMEAVLRRAPPEPPPPPTL